MEKASITEVVKNIVEEVLQRINVMAKGGDGGNANVTVRLDQETIRKTLSETLGEKHDELQRTAFELEVELNKWKAKYSDESIAQWEDRRFSDLKEKYAKLDISRENEKKELEKALKEEREARTNVHAIYAKEIARLLELEGNSVKTKDKAISTMEAKMDILASEHQTAVDKFDRLKKEKVELYKKYRDLEDRLNRGLVQDAPSGARGPSQREIDLKAAIIKLEVQLNESEALRDQRKRMSDFLFHDFSTTGSGKEDYDKAKQNYDAECQKCDEIKKSLKADREFLKEASQERNREGSVSSTDSKISTDSKTTVETASTAATENSLCSSCKQAIT